MAQEAGRTQGGPRELRLALAMRGGVSLAVWIGGTCCEIDQLRTAAPGTDFWGRLLEASGYDAVAVDILAGASAGGLNGVIYAAAQQYGFAMHKLRKLWVDLGDTEALLRTKDDAKDGAWPSLFKGDGYFFAKAREALEDLATDATPPLDPPPVTLTLSATLVEPIRRPGRSPSDEPLTETRFASGFVFEHPRQPWRATDFPPGACVGAPVWSRLALAARSTSSFPAAFEAALVRASRAAAFDAPDPGPGKELQVDMGGVFTDRGRTPDGEGRQFVVSDGGILDNIPLGRALDEIADAAAGQPTDRYLIYVQPGAPAPASVDADKAGTAEARAALGVLKGVLAARLPNEDIVGDLEQLDDYNTRIERAASLRRSGFGQLRNQGRLEKAAKRSWDGYRALRADEDQRLVSKLLEDPIEALGEDPFPARVGGQDVEDDRWRSPLDAGAPAINRRRLATALVREFLDQPQRPGLGGQEEDDRQGARHGDDEPTGPKRLPEEFPHHGRQDGRVVAAGARPLLRIISLLIEWAQYLEATAPRAAEAGRHKAKLYRTAAFVRDAIDRPRRLGWVTLAATRSLPAQHDEGESGDAAPDLTGEQRLALRGRLLTGLVRVSAEEAAQVCDALTAEAETAEHCTTLRDAVTGRLRALDGQVGSAGSTSAATVPDDAVDLRVEILCRVLVPLAGELRKLQPVPNGGEGSLGHDATPGAFLDRALDGEIGAATLEALEVVAYPEFATGLPGRRPVAFRRLSAANPTPLAPKFERLISAAQHSGTWWDRDNTDPRQQEGIHVTLKLAGNELSNFSAFLVEGWRRNDWLWGRLDAVPTLVDLLLASERFSRGPGLWDGARLEQLIAGPPEERSALQDFILDTVLDPATRDAAVKELADGSGKMPVLRIALIAARQWEILSEELGIQEPARLAERLSAYDVGAQTVGSSVVRDDTAERLTAIARVADDVAIYGTQLQFGGRFLGPPGKPKFRTRVLRGIWGFLAGILVKRYLGRNVALTDRLDGERQRGRG